MRKHLEFKRTHVGGRNRDGIPFYVFVSSLLRINEIRGEETHGLVVVVVVVIARDNLDLQKNLILC